MNILSYCDTNLRNNDISAIVGPRLSALVSVISKDYEEGVSEI
jgi:hypothetical protein